MGQNNIIKNSYDLLYLISCALHDVVPERERLEQMEMRRVYKLAKFHSLLSISFAPLERYMADGGKIDLETDTLEIWRNMRSYIIHKNLMFDFQREKLINFFEDNDIRYMSLKGLILHKLYPKMGWRYFADNDILFDREYRAAVRDFFIKQGYEVKAYENDVHDVYFKPPFLNFEMHVALFDEEYEDASVQRLADYYADSWQHAIPNDKGMGYHQSDEDFYIYLVAHAYKHVRHGGTGLRTLVDIYVYLMAKKKRFNTEYIKTELTKMKLAKFEKELRKLAMHLFSSPDYTNNLSPAEIDLLLLHVDSGTYGTFDRMVKLSIERSGGTGRATIFAKIKYCFRRLFLDMDAYRVYYPFFYKYKIFIPAFLVWRLFRAIFVRHSAVKELKVLKNTKVDRSRW